MGNIERQGDWLGFENTYRSERGRTLTLPGDNSHRVLTFKLLIGRGGALLSARFLVGQGKKERRMQGHSLPFLSSPQIDHALYKVSNDTVLDIVTRERIKTLMHSLISSLA